MGAARVAARALSRHAPRVRGVHEATSTRDGCASSTRRSAAAVGRHRHGVRAAGARSAGTPPRSSSSTACASTSGSCSSRCSRRCSRSRRRTTTPSCRPRRRIRAMRCSAGSFPARSRRASRTGGASARTRRSTRTSASCSTAQLKDAAWADAGQVPQDLDRRRLRRPRAAPLGALPAEGVSAFVFNFVDLLTHGRRESMILFEVARDEVALRQLTRQWFERSALLALLREAARRKIPVVLTSDHGSIHCNTPATVFAKRDATREPALQVRRGPARRAAGAGAPVHATRTTCACRNGAAAATRCSRPATRSSSIRPSCASTRAATAGRSCTAA